MHRDKYAVCPKCERFMLLEPNAPPLVYCEHMLPTLPWWNNQKYEPSDKLCAEKIQCKVVTIGDADENS